MAYKCILADPPWKVCGGKNGKSGWSKSVSADVHYNLMTTKEIAALPVESIAAPDSHLYLWVVNGLLADGLKVMESWGFRYVTNICWNKTSGYGIGQYFRNQHELLLFGVKGHPGYKRDSNGKKMQARSIISAPRRNHSQKPDEIRSIIEHVSNGPYIELFARQKVPDWDSWGLEIVSDIIMPSSKKGEKYGETR